MTHPDTLRSYTAGIIDGEGSIHMNCVSSADQKDKGFRSYQVVVEVAMVDPGAVQIIHAAYGGKLSIRKYDQSIRQNQYRWTLWKPSLIISLLDDIPDTLTTMQQYHQVTISDSDRIVVQRSWILIKFFRMLFMILIISALFFLCVGFIDVILLKTHFFIQKSASLC